MTGCPSCSAAVADDARFCASCGAPLDGTEAGTVHRGERPPSSGSIDHGRFVPGTMFGTRYRIVALLGRGGMGEVFRADDLKLGQPVALKLLPAEIAAREDRRARLLGEVRIARQIAHPNVCRVYDVGEIDGEHFITMEYVTGEDLASLLQRIGRLPKDKGIEIARQICAGLAAAHERGILHRDLKPANIMLDERGKVRITDFGLAALSADDTVHAAEGTPAYMAPEQLAGREATQRSDVYALGLVLYEIFTGKRAFAASSLAEMRALREQKSLTDPSRIVDDIDPAVERVILRCLESDPRDRPPSVVSVAAALPGGDPLAAALAAGETPSPELLAAAGDKVGLRPAIALPLLLFVVIGAAAVLLMRQQRHIGAYVDLTLPPDALAWRASELLRELGYGESVVDSERGFVPDVDLLRYVSSNDRSRGRWDRLRDERPPAVIFWYRQADRPLEWASFYSGTVTPYDPPPVDPGMKQVWLDSTGRLVHLRIVPPAESSGSRAAAADWNRLFAAAGLDRSRFRPAVPRRTPPMYADSRAAWEGMSPAGKPLRIEAASLQGQPVYFQLIGPWSRPEQMLRSYVPPPAFLQTFQIALFAVILLGAIFMAQRNVRLGRGDRRGAVRLALASLCVVFAAYMLFATHTPTSYEVGIVVMAASWALFLSGMIWLLYLALEPFLRRRWPHALIGWGKLLAGRVRDPVIGREVLIGTAAAVALDLAGEVALRAVTTVQNAPPQPELAIELLGHARYALAWLLREGITGVWLALAITFFLFLLRLIVRREALAVVAVVALGGAFGYFFEELGGEHRAFSGILSVVAWILLLLVASRVGLLAVAFLVGVANILSYAVPAPIGSWYGYTTWVPLLAIAAVSTFAFYTSLAGRPVFREAMLET